MRFYIVGLIAFLLSANAHAEAGTAVYAIYTWFATYGVYVAAAVAVSATVYGSANARKQAKEAAQKAKDEANASLKDRTVTVVSDEMPPRFVYGKARVGSVIVAQFTSGDKDQYKHLVCVHAAHECDGFDDFWVAGHSLGELTALGNPEAGNRFNQSNTLAYHQDFTGSSVTLTLTPDTGSVYVIRQSQYWAGGDAYTANKLSKLPDEYVSVSGKVVTVTGTWGPLRVIYQHTEEISGVSVRVHLGGATDPADLYLNGLFPTAWPSTSVLRGYCYSIVTLNLNNPEFQSGIPTIEILLRGRKDIFDPRTLTTGYSTNAALCLNNYLQKYCDIPQASIPTSYVIAAANVCDETISINDGTTGLAVNAPRYTCNGSDTTDTDPGTVIDQMATAMCGGIDATTFEMFAGTYTAPVGSLVAEDVIGAISLSPALSDADLSNGYKGQAALAENDCVSGDYTPYQNAAYFTADGIETWNSLTLPWTNNTQRVHNICRILTEDARNAFTVKAVFSLKALQYKIGQRVNFTFPLFMFADKVFRVTDKTYTASGGVELTLKEDTAEIWDEADAVVLDATPNSNAPDPWLVDPVAGLAATSGTATLEKLADGTVRPRLLVSWTNVGRDDVTIELQIEDISTGIKTLQYAAANETQTYVSNVSEFSMYAIRICAVNNFSQARSPYRWLISEVIGKSQPPSPVAGASVTVVTGGAKIAWTLPVDVDWSETEWRYGASFDAGTRIYRGTATECIWLSPAQGTYQLWGVNYDTSGIRSTTPTQLTLVFGASGLVSWNSIDGKPTDGNLVWNGNGVSIDGWNAGTATMQAVDFPYWNLAGISANRAIAMPAGYCTFGPLVQAATGHSYSIKLSLVPSGGGAAPSQLQVGLACFDSSSSHVANLIAVNKAIGTYAEAAANGTIDIPSGVAFIQPIFINSGDAWWMTNIDIRRTTTTSEIAQGAVSTELLADFAATDVVKSLLASYTLSGAFNNDILDITFTAPANSRIVATAIFAADILRGTAGAGATGLKYQIQIDSSFTNPIRNFWQYGIEYNTHIVTTCQCEESFNIDSAGTHTIRLYALKGSVNDTTVLSDVSLKLEIVKK